MRNIIITGLGGQGIVFLTRLLATAAVEQGRPVMVSETHGMSQRGGSVISHLKIGGNMAPLVQPGRADFMLALDPDEAARSLPLLKAGGTVFVNAEQALHPEIAPHLERLSIAVRAIPANRIALDLGSASIANAVMAGFAAADEALSLTIDSLRRALQRTARRGLDLNRQALDAGYVYAQNGRPD